MGGMCVVSRSGMCGMVLIIVVPKDCECVSVCVYVVLCVGEMQATGTGTGTRRAVVRSEKFMEWQREISRSVSAVRKLGPPSALVPTER